jgi:hypothetical protein
MSKAPPKSPKPTGSPRKLRTGAERPAEPRNPFANEVFRRWKRDNEAREEAMAKAEAARKTKSGDTQH